MRRFGILLLPAALGLVLAPAPATAQFGPYEDDWYAYEAGDYGMLEYEYGSGEGLDDEEWYAPSDGGYGGSGISRIGQQDQQQLGQQDRQQFRQQDQQQFGQQGQQPRRHAWQQGQPQQRQEQRQMLSGTIQNARLVKLRNSPDRHVLLTIQTQQGRTVLVDLGKPENLQDVNLNVGEQVSVTGQSHQIAGERILFADRLRDADGSVAMVTRTIDIEEDFLLPMGRQQFDQGMRRQRPGQAMGGQRAGRLQDQLQGRGTRVIVGEVIDTRTVNLGEQEGEHLLARIRTDTGRTVVVDLGRRDQLSQDIQVRQGERLAVAGVPGRISGRPVLMASGVGEFVRIQRESAGRQGSQQQTFQQQGTQQQDEQQQDMQQRQDGQQQHGQQDIQRQQSGQQQYSQQEGSRQQQDWQQRSQLQRGQPESGQPPPYQQQQHQQN